MEILNNISDYLQSSEFINGFILSFIFPDSNYSHIITKIVIYQKSIGGFGDLQT